MMATVPAHWLLKSEPDVFGYADLVRVGTEPWNGVRNYLARNHLRAMKVGDHALFYHSNASPTGIAGVAKIVRAAYTDDLQFDPASAYHDPKSDPQEPRWSMVDVAPLLAFPEVLTLAQVRDLPEWESSPLTQKGTRLSVFPVTPLQFRAALKAAGVKLPQK